METGKKEKVPKRKGMRILVATDGSEYAKKGVEYASSLALANDGKLILLHVIPYLPEPVPAIWVSEEVEARDRRYMDELFKEAEALLEEEMERLTAAGVKAEDRIEFGEPAEKIIEVAEKTKADMIVIGIRGKSTWKKIIMGSVSDKVVDRAKIPVLLIR